MWLIICCWPLELLKALLLKMKRLVTLCENAAVVLYIVNRPYSQTTTVLPRSYLCRFGRHVCQRSVKTWFPDTRVVNNSVVDHRSWQSVFSLCMSLCVCLYICLCVDQDDECTRPGQATDLTFLASLSRHLISHQHFTSQDTAKTSASRKSVLHHVCELLCNHVELLLPTPTE